MKVIDKNGIAIEAGQTVRIHQIECIRYAKVVEVFPDNPTLNQPGHWVDVEDGGGIYGMMSYILEVVAPEPPK